MNRTPNERRFFWEGFWYGVLVALSVVVMILVVGALI